MAGRWLDVGKAAGELGLSTDAVRKRIARGTLVSEEQDGRRVVWLDDGGTGAGQRRDEPSELVEELRAQNAYLRARLEEADTRDRENRRLLAAALERMPELEAPQSPERSEAGDSSPTETSGGVRDQFATGGPESAPQRRERSWWRRIFGSERG